LAKIDQNKSWDRLDPNRYSDKQFRLSILDKMGEADETEQQFIRNELEAAVNDIARKYNDEPQFLNLISKRLEKKLSAQTNIMGVQ
jgi:hypothetical protein